ncbi:MULTISPECIES: UBP-type zinc finger domain-containing protein [Streptomyces]|uniref:UBP-type zinc finger domain-containing protein n=1 Tax=Streptomyces TaxID=1883 RepID=UPI000CD5BD5F|nr:MULTISPECIES: UBP-type zinc finger domain-containing protein [Streptomyces]
MSDIPALGDDAPGVDPAAPPSGPGCAECEAQHGWWVHLRRCAQCGHVGCCDSSPGQHATGHYRATGHPYAQSYQPGEDWYWDYPSERMLAGPRLAAPTEHPAEVTTPGPQDRLPADWASRIN